MKEKITMCFTMAAILSLFLYYKISPQNSNEYSQIEVEHVIEHSIPEVAQEVKNEVISVTNEDAFCLMEQEETDELIFSDAFKYYRNCLDNEKTFTWNGTTYTTLFAEEVNNLSTDYAETETKATNQSSADKTHIQLQNEMFGNSSNE